MTFYVARQPILAKDKSLFAYELLFRQNLVNAFPEINENEATAKLIEGLQFNLGLDNLTDGTFAFINFTHDSLLDGFPLLLPKEQIVVEILETVKPGKKLLAACVDLKQKGYTIALDDYEHSAVWLHFFPYVDIIKLDYSLTKEDQFHEIIEAIKPFPAIKLLAEKIETHQEYQHAIEIGCDYFQGYFFSRPEMIKTVAFNPTQLSVIQLMSELNKNEPDVTTITSIFESEVNLSFKILRYAQSPVFKRRAKIETIKQAVVLLGLSELKRFVSLLFTAQFSADKPEELTVMSLARARFCELMSESHKQSSAFLVGLLSLLDAMVDAEITELMDKLPISEEMKQAIIQRKGKTAEFLTLCELYEKADWDKIDQYCADIKVCADKSGEVFQHALGWASLTMQTLR